MKERAVARDGRGVFDARADADALECAIVPDDGVDERAGFGSIGRRVTRTAIGKPARAPDVCGQAPAVERRCGRLQLPPVGLARPHVGHRVVAPLGQRAEQPRGSLHRVPDANLVEQRQRPDLPRAVHRQPTEIAGPRPDEAVAGPKSMVEKPQRLVACKRGEPKRQPRQVDGRRIAVDAPQAALRNRSSHQRACVVVDVGRCQLALGDERLLVRAREIPTRGHEERTAAHGRIDDAQSEDRIRRCLVDERRERAAHHVVGKRLRRVESSCLLANVTVASIRCRTPGHRRRRRHVVLEIEHAFVHRPELFDAQVAVIDRLESAAAGPGPERDEGLAQGLVARAGDRVS